MITIWNCPTIDSKILTADLRWFRAGDVREGDVLVGVDEHIPQGRRIRRYCQTRVTKVEHGQADVFDVCFSDGSQVEVTADHQWLVSKSTSSNRHWHWCKTSDLTMLSPQTTVQKLVEPWDNGECRDAGWLAGFFDGEGSLSYSGVNETMRLSVCQNIGPTLAYAVSLLKRNQMVFAGGANTRNKDCKVVALRASSVGDALRLLGWARPTRLLPKLDISKLGVSWARNRPYVIKVQPRGVKTIAKIATESRTYILEGYIAHNCNFDRPRVEAAHNMRIPREAVVDAMDAFHTLNNAFKRKLGFASSLNPLNHGLPMWKHLNRSNPELYSCLDALGLLRDYYYYKEQFAETGAAGVWDLLHTRLDPVLDHMHTVGMFVDDDTRQEISTTLAADLETLTQQMNAIVPEAVRSPKVWVSQANAIKGRATLAARMRAEGDPGAERIANAPIFAVPATRKAMQCARCGEVDVKADHITRKTLKKAVDNTAEPCQTSP